MDQTLECSPYIKRALERIKESKDRKEIIPQVEESRNLQGKIPPEVS